MNDSRKYVYLGMGGIINLLVNLVGVIDGLFGVVFIIFLREILFIED